MFIRKILLAAAFLAALFASHAFAAVGDLRALRVVDADGKTVGRWSDGTVLISARGKLAYVDVERISNKDARMTWAQGSGVLQFETADCTGNGYLTSNPYSVRTGFTPSIAYMPDTGGVYLYLGLSLLAKDPPQLYRSYLGASGCTRNDNASRFPAWVFDGIPIDLGSQFKLPLQIK